MAKTRHKMSEEEKKAKRRESKKLAMRKLREKKKTDVNAIAEDRRKARERYYKRKEKGLVKRITELTPREQRAIRKNWRDRAKRYRDRIKQAKISERIIREETPPSSEISQRTASTSRASAGKKAALRNRRKLKHENNYLRGKVQILETRLAKYRMRDKRREQRKIKKSKEKLEEEKKRKSEEKKKRSEENRNQFRRLREDIVEFYLEDTSSRLTAGKKETITRKKIKKQIRLLNDTTQNLYKAYLEKSGVKISYNFFCQSKPFWVISPTEKTRNTCLCATHCNIANLVKAMRNVDMVKYNSPNELVRSICCPGKLKEICLERRCSLCKNKKVEYNEFNGLHRFMFEKWISKKVKVLVKGSEKLCQKTVKENTILSKLEAVKFLEEKLAPYMKHLANIYHQHQVMQQVKNNMADTEALIHIDFSENYCCKYGEEVQSAHFGGSKPQISLHTVVLYTMSNGQLQTDSICTMSENVCHDSVFVCAHLTPLFDLIKQNVPRLDTLHILSDGAGNQYRNRKMFQLIVTYICPRLHISTVMWHYNESGHGKGAPDGVGGCLKRTADRAAALGKDVNNFEKLTSYLTDNCAGVKIIPIDDSNIDVVKKGLQGAIIRPFRGTLSVHQVTWSCKNPNLLRFRRLSCVSCLPENYCEHYELGTVTVPERALTDDIHSSNRSESLCQDEPPSEIDSPSRSESLNAQAISPARIQRSSDSSISDSPDSHSESPERTYVTLDDSSADFESPQPPVPSSSRIRSSSASSSDDIFDITAKCPLSRSGTTQRQKTATRKNLRMLQKSPNCSGTTQRQKTATRKNLLMLQRSSNSDSSTESLNVWYEGAPYRSNNSITFKTIFNSDSD